MGGSPSAPSYTPAPAPVYYTTPESAPTASSAVDQRIDPNSEASAKEKSKKGRGAQQLVINPDEQYNTPGQSGVYVPPTDF